MVWGTRCLPRVALRLYTYTVQSLMECAPRLTQYNTTFSNGSLGSRIDEERSEMR
jgi:hypothetical protein